MTIVVVRGVDKNGLEDCLPFYAFPKLDARKISFSNMIERLNLEIHRRTSVVGIFPNEESYVRLATTYLIEYAEGLVCIQNLPQSEIHSGNTTDCSLTSFSGVLFLTGFSL